MTSSRSQRSRRSCGSGPVVFRCARCGHEVQSADLGYGIPAARVAREGRVMAFRKVSYLIPSCDGCGLAWSFFDPACVARIPPHFACRAAALEQLPRDYGWQVRPRRLGRPLMACRRCAAAGVIPAGVLRGWLLAASGWVRRVVPFGLVRRALPPHSGPEHPESLTAELAAEDEELLAAIEDENFPEL